MKNRFKRRKQIMKNREKEWNKMIENNEKQEKPPTVSSKSGVNLVQIAQKKNKNNEKKR